MKLAEYQRPPIKVALMGLGRAMFEDHYPILRDHPALFKVVCACDLIKERRDLVAQDFPHCKMFRQFSDMLDERDIDLVVIATCTSDHVEHAMESLKRGYWTLLESPMAMNPDEAAILRGQALKSGGRLLIVNRGLFAPDFLLTRQMMADPRLGQIYQLRIRCEDYLRRYDWQCVKRLGGGAAYYAMPDMVLQALKLLPTPPVQMWSELKRIAALGDAEDYAHLNLKTREVLSAEIEYSGGVLAPNRVPAFELRAERGVFQVATGATEGMLTVINPQCTLSRRRSSVRTPPLADMHETIPVVTIPVSLAPETKYGQAEFWRHVYDSVRTAKPFPFPLEDAIEAVKFAHLMKRTSPFGK